jgi:acetolactate synthase I/II/III large subunit
MRATGGRLVYETLKSYGVTCIFGMEDPIQLFHAVDRGFTRIVTVRDEKHGAIMAHGFAQASGRPGVCAATFGPGATNLVTGLYEAQRSSVPVIALVQDHPLRLKGRNANSELDHAAALAPVVKAVVRVDSAEAAGDAVRRAFRLATGGRPGPVALLLPTDALAAEGECETHAEAEYRRFPALRPRAGRAGIAAAAAALAAAKRPVLIAGGGTVISGAFDEVKALAERFAAPVATTLTGRGAIADDHPLAVGPIGNQSGGKLGRGRVANAVAGEADLAFILGSRTGQLCYADWKLFPPGTRIVHLDIDAAEIGRNFPTEIGLVGDVRETLRDLLEHAAAAGLGRVDRGNGGRIAALMEEWRAANAAGAASSARPIRPERLVAEVARMLDRSALVVADASYATAWALSHFDVPEARRFVLSPRGTGSIGWGFAAALGAKLAAPERSVVCLNGDGGFAYAMNELETAARYGIKVLTVILNNATLGYQRHWEEKAMGRYLECDFRDVDFAAIARAQGCAAERVTDPAGIAAALARGLAAAGPYLVDVVVDPAVAGPIAGMERPIAADAAH